MTPLEVKLDLKIRGIEIAKCGNMFRNWLLDKWSLILEEIRGGEDEEMKKELEMKTCSLRRGRDGKLKA